jgi:DnaJ like chaperone protein
MSWTATVIGAIFGLLFGGFPGLFLGLMLGFTIDTGLIDKWRNRFVNREDNQHVKEVFFNTTFKMMGYLAKSDGRVSESEIQAAQQTMVQMGLDANQRRRAIRAFNQGKQPDFDLASAIVSLREQCWRHPSLLKVFIEVQLQIASAEGSPSPAKLRALENICQQLGIFGFNFGAFAQQFGGGQYQRHQQQHRYSSNNSGYQFNPRQSLSEAYQVLGVGSNSSKEEVKKAYRRQMSQHHPDRLIAKGVPESMIKIATAKTQKIKQAYEDICKAKGW